MRKRIIVMAVLIGVSLVLVGVSRTGDGFFDESRPVLSAMERAGFDVAIAAAYPAHASPVDDVVAYSMRASESQVQMVDGLRTRVWAYDGSVPGPTLRVRLGQTLRLTFDNDLPEETTIHFHGVRVPNAMDGVPGVTQDPIASGERFVYEFTPKDAGTFWFHPHVRTSEQLGRGLYGVLVVEDAQPLPYSRDAVWVVDDWRLDASGQIAPFGNGHDIVHNGRWGDTVTVNGSTQQKLLVKPGERIRLRMVNASNARIYQLRVDGLSARVIAVDGMYTREPFSPDGFEFAPGNRLDLDITIPQHASGNYEIVDVFTGARIVLGTIIVDGSSVVTPDFPVPSNPRVPRWDAGVVMPDHTLVLAGGMGSMMHMGATNAWTINAQSFPRYDAVSFTSGKTVIVQFRNDSTWLHPMHLHGQFFMVIARDGDVVNEGYLRDTVLVHPNEVVDVALVPMDVGTWALHCHVLEHADAGMMTLFEVAD